MNLSPVSRTAITTLTARAVEAGRKNAAYHDPMAVLCLERLMAVASAEERKWILRQKRLYAGMQAIHAKAVARRVKAIDEKSDLFLSRCPDATVVNLACGLDTRFWRMETRAQRYIEIDLPEMIALKKEILKDRLEYELIGCSVLDASWMDRVAAERNSRFLFLAEGLFMYLPKPDAMELFRRLGQRFQDSQLILDVPPETYTRGIWKKLMALETKITWGLETTYVFGLRNPNEIESYGSGLRITGVEKAGMGMGSIISVSINAA